MIAVETRDIGVKYGEKVALKSIDLGIEKGEVATLIGPNGSGKSTLIKVLAGYKRPWKGKVFLDGEDICDITRKDIAKRMAVLPQVKSLFSDITVEELVSYGRYPHLGFGKRLGNKDREIVDWAIDRTGLIELKGRYVETLSGGERQRAWIAMALAQQPRIILLDEPTTYLDISYQLEILELIRELNKSLSLTVIMVLHDINQASRYSDSIYVLVDGQVHSHGSPRDIINPNLLKDVFRIDSKVYWDEVNDCPYFIPQRIVK